MGYKNVREKLIDNETEIEEDTILLEEDVFVDSLIGVSSDSRAIYDYGKMIEEYAKKTGCSFDDAIDYVSNGIVRWIECYSGKTPVIQYSFVFDGKEDQTGTN